MWWSFGKLVGLSVIGTMLAVLPFVLKVTDDCVDSLIGHSVWMGGTFLFLSWFSLVHSLNLFVLEQW